MVAAMEGVTNQELSFRPTGGKGKYDFLRGFKGRTKQGVSLTGAGQQPAGEMTRMNVFSGPVEVLVVEVLSSGTPEKKEGKLDTVEGISRIPQAKVVELKRCVGALSRKKKAILGDLQQLTGRLNFASGAITAGRPFTKSLAW
ncbi:hypothetical protein NDU88_006903 [Pleurodeles waltl]|uniref:Uncharacterized protein n=1 Tax=Pleurodeles waltl TaxID=8319 RepID=A0AAV7UQF0_PLEWA|nr:hypothetical protein NDU88_006903 [Pleurodeles waltl]